MLIIQKGYVKHRGVLFGPGQVLPEMPKKEEQRLLDLGVCFEGDIPRLEKVAEEEVEHPTKATEVVEEEYQTPNAGIDLSFNPDDVIKTKGKAK